MVYVIKSEIYVKYIHFFDFPFSFFGVSEMKLRSFLALALASDILVFLHSFA